MIVDHLCGVRCSVNVVVNRRWAGCDVLGREMDFEMEVETFVVGGGKFAAGVETWVNRASPGMIIIINEAISVSKKKKKKKTCPGTAAAKPPTVRWRCDRLDTRLVALESIMPKGALYDSKRR